MPELLPLVVVLVLVGIVMLTALVVVRARSSGPRSDDALHSSAASVGMSIGMLLGALLGTVVWVSTGEFVFWVIFMGGGMTVGLAAGTGVASRRG